MDAASDEQIYNIISKIPFVEGKSTEESDTSDSSDDSDSSDESDDDDSDGDSDNRNGVDVDNQSFGFIFNVDYRLYIK